jgi:hypothetical protein
MTSPEHNPDQDPDQGFSGAEEMLNALEQPDEAEPSAEHDIRQTLAERHPDWPPVKIEFYFGPHETAKDYPDLKEKLQKADIYFYEDAGGHRDLQEERQELADKQPILPGGAGRTVLRKQLKGEQIRGTTNEAITRAIYGSGKVVESFDLTKDDPIQSKDMRAELTRNWWYEQDFAYALAHLNANVRRLAELQVQREQIMEQRLETRLEEIVAERPELLDKPEINVLSTLGSVHTGLYISLKQRGENVTRDFDAGTTYSNYTELVRQYIFGREPSHEQIARTYLEDVVGRLSGLDDTKDDVNDYTIYMRELTGKFGLANIADIHDIRMKGQRLGKDVTDELLDKVADIAGTGPVPRSKKELHERAEEIRRA